VHGRVKKIRVRNVMKALLASILLVVCAVAVYPPSVLTQAPAAPRNVPAKSIPVPSDVSPELQAIIAQPLRPNWDNPPTTPDAWRQLAEKLAAAAGPQVAAMAERLHVNVRPDTIDGVKVYRLTPEQIPTRNADRLAIHVHGGCYVLNPHEAALPEARIWADECDRGRLPHAARRVFPGSAR
jgi:epsilon-lactone hydrolase